MAKEDIITTAVRLDDRRVMIEVFFPLKANVGEVTIPKNTGSLRKWLIVLTVFALLGVLAGLAGGYHMGFRDASQAMGVAEASSVVKSAVLASHTTAAQTISGQTIASMQQLALQKTRDCLNYLDECQTSIVNLLERSEDDWRISMSCPDPRWLDGLDVSDEYHRYLKKARDAQVDLEVSASDGVFVVNVLVPAYSKSQASAEELPLPDKNFGRPAENLEMIPPVVREAIVAYFAQNIFCALGECYAEELTAYSLQLNFKTVLVWNEEAALDEGGHPLVIGQWTGWIPANAAPRTWYAWRTIGPSQFRNGKLIEYEV